jgi:CheY-like chemotaxis protein
LNDPSPQSNNSSNHSSENSIKNDFSNFSGSDLKEEDDALDNHHTIINKNKILIVDDNLFINLSMKNSIEKLIQINNLNYELITATDGVDILNLIREDQAQGNLIRCIITDENMEYLNGSQAIKLIRELEQQGKIKPVNIITATYFEDEISKQYLLNCGAELILPKPFEPSDVESAFRQLNIIV